MAIEKLIETGNKLRDEQQYEEAIEQYDLALRENPKAFKALIEKSIALQRFKKADQALEILQQALKIAKQRGNRTNIGLVYFRYFTLYNSKSEFQKAVEYLNSAADFGHDEKEVQLWHHQIKRKIEKAGVKDIDFEARVKEDSSKEEEEEDLPIEEQKKALEQKMAYKDNLFPVPKNIRQDWFQSNEIVTVTLFVKNLPTDDSLKVKYNKSSISLEFPTSTSSEFQYEIGPLFQDINPNESSHRVFSTKLELYLAKATPSKWSKLEREDGEEISVAANPSPSTTSSGNQSSGLSYPNSARNAKDWSKLDLDDDDDEDEAKGENAFFAQLYKNADDDTKRAMMKSFTESNGTALSTNWEEVSKKTVETSPPDGLEARKW